jgi:hypothetical protein
VELPVIVDDLRLSSVDDRCEISARVRRGDGDERRLWYRFPGQFAPAQVDGSPFLAGLLVWAMRNREDVTVDAPVSPRLLASVDQVMAVYRSMYPQRYRRVSVSAPEGAPPPATELTGSFFSRGVDSWFAVLTALEDDPQSPPLTHLVFSRDFFPVDGWTPEVVEARARATLEAAARTGCEAIELNTNLKREFGGAQLASGALALGFSRMIIPSGSMHGELVPAGTHPALDYRFSTERTEIVHYGDANRLTKVERVARSPLALDTLHVCRWNRTVTEHNCGRCEKCLRTMLELHLVDALNGGPKFDQPLNPAGVASLDKELGVNRHIWVEILHALKDRPGDGQLAAAVRLIIAQSDLSEASDELRALGEEPGLAELGAELPVMAKRARLVALSAHAALRPESPSRLRALGRRAAGAALWWGGSGKPDDAAGDDSG